MDNRKHMRTEKKTAVKNSFGRLLATGIFVLIQVAWLAYLLLYFYRDYAWISLLSTFIAIILVLKIYGTSTNSAMKMPWIIVILAFPTTKIVQKGIMHNHRLRHFRPRYRVTMSIR